MRRLTDLWYRVRALVDRARMDRDLDEELAFHLDREMEKLRAQGMSPRTARREAYRRFGGVERHRDQAREARGVRWVEDTIADARLGLRRMARSPGFSVLAVLTLALGIGGTSAMFGMVNALLLRSLPYPDSDRLVWVASAAMITPQNLEEWRGGLGSVEELGAFDLRSGVLAGRMAARNAVYMSVSDEYLRILGARPTYGRLWSTEEAAPDGPPVTLVSHRVWLEELGGSDLAGRSVTVGETTYDVVGVLPADFHNLDYDADLWVPLSRARGSLNIVARLRPGATVADAQDEVDALLPRLAPPPGADRFGRRATVVSVRDQFVGDIRTPVLVLFGAAGLVLILACANVSALLLGRAVGRTRELAVRSALGARRRALVRQLLVESGVLAICGGLGGLALSGVALRAMTSLAPPYLDRALIGEARVDPTVLAFTMTAAGLATLLAGLAPALLGTHATTLGTARATATRRARRWHEALVTGEVALAMVLLIGTTLLVRTYTTLRPSSPGFEVEDRLAMELTLPGLRHIRDNLGPSPDDPANADLLRQVLRDLEASTPGARAAAVTSLPLSGRAWGTSVVAVDGEPVEPEEGDRPVRVDFQSVTPGYMGVMGMAAVRGRGLAETDVRGSQAATVLNQTAASMLWPEEPNPVGRRLTLDPYGASLPRPSDSGTGENSPPPLVELTVVGVVGDVRSSGIHTGARPEAYVSYWQFPWPLVQLVVHDPGRGVSADRLRSAVAELDPTVPLGDVTTVRAIASRAVSQRRYETVLMALFGTLAVALALIGCYGVMAHAVAERTREISVRIALGATSEDVAGEIVRRGARLMIVGLVSGALLAVALTRVLESSLYGVSPTDPTTFAGAAVALGLAVLGAAWLPARRAARVDPILTLKAE